MTGRLRTYLRQRRHHRAFRIDEPAWDAGQRARMAGLLTALTEARAAADRAATDQAAAAPPNGTAPPGALATDRSVAEAANALWRAQLHLGRVEPSWDAKQTGRHLRDTQDALADAGVVIQDHQGSRFHPGLSLEVLTVEQVPGLSEEVVLETVRPTVYLHDRQIQTAQVIVGRPASRP
ncbi:MAG: hypothetical protein ACT4RN_01435 [Pseudonocardia sp.]